MNISKLKEGLKKVSGYIESLNVSPTQAVPTERRQLTTFSRSELGGLVIWDQEVTDYRDCMKMLSEAINDIDEILSNDTIEQALQDTILTVIDVNKNFKGLSFDQRLGDALNELEKRLTRNPVSWDVYFPVLGVKLTTACFELGRVRLLPTDEDTMRILWQRGREIIKRSSSPDEAKAWSEKHLKSEIKKELSEGVISWIKVQAVDEKAARSRAMEYLNLTLDVLNFYTLLVHPRGIEVRAYLPGQATFHAHTLSIAYRENEQYNLESGLRGPIELFALEHLTNNAAARKSLSVLSPILKKDRPNSFEQRIIAAFRFAGRATVSRIREEAFLQHAIALESLLSDQNATGEITFKLAARCAHLIGSNSEERSEVFKEMKKLYGVRSKIVHQGQTQINDVQLSRLQYYVRSALYAISTHQDLTAMQSDNQFLQWFDDKLLA